MGSLLAALTTIIVTALAAALAAPYVLDWNDYKSVFEAQATRLLGRSVRVEGNVGLTILPVPEVRLKGVRVADEAGGFQRPFAEAETFNMTLSLPPLLSGMIEAKTIQLDQPIIRFEVGANGQGNWATLGPAKGAPGREVVLSKVIIKDGAIEYRGAPDGPATRIDRISGTFAADSLSGPFRFTGFGALGRDRRELKLSASRAQRDNAMRLKVTLGSPGGGSLYQLDGDLKNAGGAMQYVGPVLARLELGGVAGKGGQPEQPPRAKAIELRAGSTISFSEARLQDIALTVTENDRPQSFTGSAYAAWGDEPRLDLSLQTAFLDIDQMIGTSGGKIDPLAAIAALPHIFEGWAFEPREGKIRATIQQATLGGDTLEGVTFAATHNRDFWQVETLEARLPGDAPLSIQGVLQPGEKMGFTGEFNLSGKNLPKLLRWAAPSLGAVDTGDAQRFSLKGGMTYADQRFTFRRGAGELGGSSFAADLAYDFSDASKLMLTLQSDRLDLRSIYGGNPFAPDDAPVPAAQAPADPKAAKTSLFDAFRSVFAAKQSQISLRIAQLSMPDLEARDVRTSFRYENGNLDIRELNLATTDGLSIKADGALTNFDTSPNGSVNLGVNAPSTASLANLAKLFGLESFGTAAQRRMDALAPLRLTGKLSGNRQDRLMNLTLAGSAAGSELAMNGRFNGEFNALKDARIELSGTITSADGRRLIAQLAPEVPLSADASRAGAGLLKISALGGLKTGLITKLELRTPDAEGRFEGQLGLLDSPAWGLNGDLWLRSSQARTALSMLRMSPGGTPVSGELDLRAALSKKASTFKAENVSLQIGGETIAGSATVDIAGERPVATIDVRATTLVLPKLAAYLVDWDRKDNTATAEAMLAGKGENWPNQSFSFRGFNAVEGSLKVKAPSVVLTDGITLANGQLDASMKAGTLTVETLNGQIYSGALTASGTLAASNGRMILKGKLKLDKADLARLTTAGDGKPLAKATGEFRLAFSGEGLSPRGLLTVLSGKGRVRIGKGTLFGLSPAVLGQAAETYITEDIPQQAKMTQRIARDLRQAQGAVPFRGFFAPVVLKDGVIEVRNAAFKSADYLAKANLFVDLSANKLDSEWALAWRGKSKVLASPLAPVHLVFAGPVATFTTLKPQLQTEEYERALSIQRMDKDMERLEKLNRGPASLSPSGTPPRDQIVTRPPSVPAPPPSTVTAAPLPPAAALPPGDGLSTRPTAAPAQPITPPPASGWATGVENSGKAPARAEGNASQPPRAFEDEIRRILQEQQRNNTSQQTQPPAQLPAAPPKSPQSSLSYQTQSYSQSADAAGSAAIVEAEAEPDTTLHNVPMPAKKSASGNRPAQPSPQSGFWKFFQ